MALKGHPPLSEVLGDVSKRWLSVRTHMANWSARCAAGPVASEALTDNLLSKIQDDLAYFEAAKATPGLGQYARVQYNDEGYDIGAEFNAFIAALEGVRDYILTAAPIDGNRFLLEKTFNVDGSITKRTFSVGQTATLRAALDAVVAAVEPPVA